MELGEWGREGDSIATGENIDGGTAGARFNNISINAGETGRSVFKTTTHCAATIRGSTRTTPSKLDFVTTFNGEAVCSPNAIVSNPSFQGDGKCIVGDG